MKLNPYGKLCTQVYDLSKPEPPVDAFNFYLNQAKSTGGTVLELMCGSGRFLIPLMEQGIDIDGSDASPDMLQACRAKCVQKGLEPVLYEQLIEETTLPKKYRLIFIAGCSFILVTDKQAVRTSLRKIYEHLLPVGRLVIEIETPRAVGNLGVWTGFWVVRPDGATIAFNSLASYNPTEKIEQAIHKYELFENGRLTATELERFAMRFYETDEFTDLLKEAGFANIRSTRPFVDSEPDEKDAMIVFSAEK